MRGLALSWFSCWLDTVGSCIALRIDRGLRVVCGTQAGKITILGVIMIHATYSGSSYFSQLNGVSQPKIVENMILLSIFSLLFFEQGYLCDYIMLLI